MTSKTPWVRMSGTNDGVEKVSGKVDNIVDTTKSNFKLIHSTASDEKQEVDITEQVLIPDATQNLITKVSPKKIGTTPPDNAIPVKKIKAFLEENILIIIDGSDISGYFDVTKKSAKEGSSDVHKTKQGSEIVAETNSKVQQAETPTVRSVKAEEMQLPKQGKKVECGETFLIPKDITMPGQRRSSMERERKGTIYSECKDSPQPEIKMEPTKPEIQETEALQSVPSETEEEEVKLDAKCESLANCKGTKLSEREKFCSDYTKSPLPVMKMVQKFEDGENKALSNTTKNRNAELKDLTETSSRDCDVQVESKKQSDVPICEAIKASKDASDIDCLAKPAESSRIVQKKDIEEIRKALEALLQKLDMFQS